MFLFWALPGTARRDLSSAASTCHPPRRRRIQYSVASRLNHGRLGILDRPVKPDDDG